jgi:hypothetical protein
MGWFFGKFHGIGCSIPGFVSEFLISVKKWARLSREINIGTPSAMLSFPKLLLT